MGHSSGIPVSEELARVFGDARLNEDVRYIKVQIKNDELVNVFSCPVGDVEADFASLVSQMEPKIPAFFVFRMDTKNVTGYEWALLAYVPDDSAIKERMLYASTRDIMKRQLGHSYFAKDFYGSVPEDFTWENYTERSTLKGEAVLSDSERMKENAATLVIDHGHTREYVHSVKFPVSQAAILALQNLASGSVNLVLLSVDVSQESIELDQSGTHSIGEIPSILPTDDPRFTLYRYVHEHDGANLTSFVMIYSCSNYAHVKKKMLYSTVKAAVAEVCNQQGVTIEKKFEVTENEEITEQLINEGLHPETVQVKKNFSRPSRPGRGRARLTKRG